MHRNAAGGGSALSQYGNHQDASYQPLSRYLFIYVSAESATKPELKEFIEFYLTTGTALVKEANYVPLVVSAYQIALTNFLHHKLGTVIAGAPGIGVDVEVAIYREGEL